MSLMLIATDGTETGATAANKINAAISINLKTECYFSICLYCLILEWNLYFYISCIILKDFLSFILNIL